VSAVPHRFLRIQTTSGDLKYENVRYGNAVSGNAEGENMRGAFATKATFSISRIYSTVVEVGLAEEKMIRATWPFPAQSSRPLQATADHSGR
jgi:hypothetical protein